MNPVTINNRKISYNDNGHLQIQNKNGKLTPLKLSGKFLIKSFEINVGDLNVVDKGLEITGKKSGRKSIVKNENIQKIFSFVDNPVLSKTELDQDGATIYIEKMNQIMENRKTVKLKESDLQRIIGKVLREQKNERYMFFQNLEQIKRECEELLSMDENEVESILESGHDWAQDHIATAKESIDQVYDFIINEMNGDEDMDDSDGMIEESEITEKKKKNIPTNPTLWKKSLSWAKSRYKVCPSAYCNGAAAKRYKSLGGKWKKK